MLFTVVQTKICQNRVFGQKNRRRRLRRRKISESEVSFSKLCHLLGGGSLVEPFFLGEHLRSDFSSNMYQIWPKVGSCGVSEGPRRPYCCSWPFTLSLLLFRALNVKLLLFTGPIVVLLLLLTVRTLFIQQLTLLVRHLYRI